MAGSTEDRRAINDLFVRHTTALDAGKVETVVGCLTADGSLGNPLPSAALRAKWRFANSRAGRPACLSAQWRDMIANLSVVLAGERAQATYYLLGPLIKAAGWIVDLGPEGSDAGGEIVAEGTPDHFAQIDGCSYTGKSLRDLLLRANDRSIPRAVQTPIQ